jgi:hypothetical protein
MEDGGWEIAEGTLNFKPRTPNFEFQKTADDICLTSTG